VGLHGLQNLQESARLVFVSLQILHHTSAKIALQINSLRVLQGGLLDSFIEGEKLKQRMSATRKSEA
jgi:hypothetical protein